MRYFWFLFLSTPLLANTTDFSLFLSPAEQNHFNENVSHHIHPTPTKGITLKAVMMVHEDCWTIWINEHKITQESCPEHIKVLKVTRDSVDIIWKTKETEHKLHLKSHQTIDLNVKEKNDL